MTLEFAPWCGYCRIAKRFLDEPGIASVAVNDTTVLAAWGREHGATGNISLLSDGRGACPRAPGLEQDLSSRGYGMRSKRYARRIEDARVAGLYVEAPGEYGVSSAEALLQQLGA